METIVIFGSSGTTGICAVEAAIEKGITVRAFVRDPAKLPSELRDKVEVVAGDVLNYAQVLEAVKGVSGVVVVLGTRNDLKPTTALSEGTKNILQAMTEAGVKKMSACMSAFLFYEPEKVPAMFKDLNADHQRQLDLIKASNKEFVAVLPPHISDCPSGEIVVQHDSSPGRIVSKHDLGKF